MVLDDLTKQVKQGGENELRYLSPLKLETKPEKKHDFFKERGIKYIDYKDPVFLKKFLNAQGKILPRHLTGTSLKNQKKLATAIKRARHIGLLPFMTDEFK
ncbi:MAG: 30S ribosomal protein S18 [Flavobacteriales bacterium AspAUS03]